MDGPDPRFYASEPRAGAGVPLEAKRAFLSSPAAYAEKPARVECVETHFAYVFLTDRFAYKLKKPIRFHGIDFTSLESRRLSSESELSLNSRLAADVYIEVVPLSAAPGGLALGARPRSEVVDWLVRMHRLPRSQMLDARAVRGDVSDAELRALLARLTAFYARARRADWDGPGYRHHLERRVRAAARELAALTREFAGGAAEALGAEMLAFLNDRAAEIEARCAAGRVVEAHGDLRPEHILLAEEPQIIDCLEFSTELRLLDTAEEIAFLALECAELGQAELADSVVAIYREMGADPVPERLLAFYRGRRALVRARSCAWRLEEDLPGEQREHWIGRTQRYLEAAKAAVAAG